MKILICTGVYPPEAGGPATYTKLLEQYLPPRGITIDVLPFRVVRHLPPGVRHIVYAWKVFALARKVDAILAQDTFSTGLPAVVGSKLAGRPLVVRVPGDYAWEQATQRFDVTDSIDDFQDKRYEWRVESLRRVQRFVVRSADTVIVPSTYFAGIVSQWGLSEKKIEVVYNGVESFDVPNVKRKDRQIVSIGRLLSLKGFSGVIYLMKEMPNWQLLIVGDGPEEEKLKNLVVNLGLEDRVRLIGSKPREEMIRILAESSVFVLNTSSESFSFQVVEAMRSGVPVIATNVGSLPELISNGEEGILVAPDDKEGIKNAIKRFDTDTIFREDVVRAAKEKAQFFNIERTADNIAEVFNETSHRPPYVK